MGNKSKRPKNRPVAAPPKGAVARWKAEARAARARLAALEAPVAEYMDHAETVVRELQAENAALRRQVERLGAERVRVVPSEMDAPRGGLFSTLAADGVEVRRAQLTGSAWLLVVSGAPEDVDRATALGIMLRGWAAEHGADAMVLTLPAGVSAHQAAGTYRIEPVETAAAAESEAPAAGAAPDTGAAGHAELRPREPGDPPPEPGTVEDPDAYAAAIAAGHIAEIPPEGLEAPPPPVEPPGDGVVTDDPPLADETATAP